MAQPRCTVVRGIVLRETETKESDKILTLLTDLYGKISVIARGARRKSCKFSACAQPLVFSEWTLYHRKDWFYVNEGTTLELFEGLRADLNALSLGAYFAELTEAVAQEGEPVPELLRHLLNGLYALSTLGKPLKLVKAAFELKLLALSGYEPMAECCAVCGREDVVQPVLDAVEGVVRCRTCGEQSRALLLPLCAGSLEAMRHILYGDPKRLYSFQLGEASLQRLSAAAEAVTLAQLDRGFRTLDFYKRLESPQI